MEKIHKEIAALRKIQGWKYVSTGWDKDYEEYGCKIEVAFVIPRNPRNEVLIASFEFLTIVKEGLIIKPRFQKEKLEGKLIIMPNGWKGGRESIMLTGKEYLSAVKAGQFLNTDFVDLCKRCLKKYKAD